MLIFLDLETTGLYDAEVLEVAVVVVDSDLQELGSFSRVVRPSLGSLHNLSPAVRSMHSANGLLTECQRGDTVSVVDQQLVYFLLSVLDKPDGWILAGNSIHFDRRYLHQFFPQTYSRLSHRMVDVSSIVELARRWSPVVYEERVTGGDEHRALGDCYHSINQLKYLRDTFLQV